MGLGLGIDAGGTATRWRLAERTAMRRAGSVDPLTGHLFSAAAEERASRSCRHGSEPSLKTGRPHGHCRRNHGPHPRHAGRGDHAGPAGKPFEISSDKVFVAEDMWIAYLSYFALGEGILVYSGTGSIGYYLVATRR